MAKPSLQTLQDNSEIHSTFQISSDATDFFISIMFINELGQSRNLKKSEFKKIKFDSTYKSPFVIGSLQLFADKNISIRDTSRGTMGTPALVSEYKNKKINDQAGGDYENIGTGGEFIHIKIEQQSTATRCEREVLVDKVYITKNVEPGLFENEKMLTYYFADVEWGSLMYQNSPWSTNDYVSWGPDHSEWGQDQNNPWEAIDTATSEGVAHLSRDQCGIKVSDAIKYLIRSFCGQFEGITLSTSIINEQEWDESSSKIMYTLPQNTPPIIGLFDLLSKYISKIHGDMGILTYYNGMFSLRSLTNIINDSINLNARAVSINSPGPKFKRKFAGVVKIETDDIRMHYSKRQSHSMFAGPEFKNLLVPVHISKATFHKKQPDTSTNQIVDHTITSYNIGEKGFKLYKKQGSVENMKKTFHQYMDNFDDPDDKEMNVNTTARQVQNKTQVFNLHTSEDQDNLYGKVMLQQKILDSSDKVTLDLSGVGSKNNWLMTGGKFIGIEVAGEKLDSFMENVPGFWFILRNITTLQEGQFNTKLVCSKIDKFIRQTGTRTSGAS